MKEQRFNHNLKMWFLQTHFLRYKQENIWLVDHSSWKLYLQTKDCMKKAAFESFVEIWFKSLEKRRN